MPRYEIVERHKLVGYQNDGTWLFDFVVPERSEIVNVKTDSSTRSLEVNVLCGKPSCDELHVYLFSVPAVQG
jgi:hypothetical protein